MSTWQDLKDNPRLRKIFETRIEILRLIREFFWSEGFLETDVPLAVRYPGQEPYLNPLPLTIHDPNGVGKPLYLHTSPEYGLKKILAVGFEKIFHATKTFRDYESFGGNHNPEFTMIEWYRAPGTYQDFMDDMENLFKFVAKKLNINTLRYRDKEIVIAQPWKRISMKELWQKYIVVNLDDYLETEPMKKLVAAHGFTVNETDEYEDLFFKIFLNEIEQKLGFDAPTFVYDYPKRMSSLSRACAHDPRYAERVECYALGLELCNGFGELLDADEQKMRLEADQALRQKLSKETWPVDEELLVALRAIAARAATAGGVAMGVDRMILLFTGAKDINEVVLNSLRDQFPE